MANRVSTVTAALGKSIIAEKILELRRPTLLLAADLAGILGVAVVLILVRMVFFPQEAVHLFKLLPLLLIGPVFFYIEGLYDSIAPPFPQELRRISIGISVAYMVVGLVLFFVRSEALPSRMVLLGAWLFALVITPYLRVLVRSRFAAQPWWGKNVVIFGPAEMVGRLTRFLRFAPENGLRPGAVVCQDSDENSDPFVFATLPQLKDFSEVEAYAAEHKNSYAIILGDAVCSSDTRELMERTGRLFPSVLVVVGYMGNETPMWLSSVEVAHTLALQMRQNLFDPRRLFLKRIIDLVGSACGLLLLLPFFIAAGLWIKFETPGPVFYTHRRLGLGGTHFSMLKFRTMVANADAVLEECLAKSPELREEWARDHKLRDDPRVTRAGRFLRRLSLDEFPQVLNVLRGDMSLVGPRPIVDAEIEKYGSIYDAYKRVRPGMTGLWQVSGRSDTSYAYRVGIDNYYICNWSICMDVWILARTPKAVLKGSGAY